MEKVIWVRSNAKMLGAKEDDCKQVFGRRMER